jgi:hypothetical protein
MQRPGFLVFGVLIAVALAGEESDHESLLQNLPMQET